MKCRFKYTKVKIKKIDITMILDRSGSMQCMDNQVIKSFNSFLTEQKSVRGDACISLIQFDHEYKKDYSAIDLEDAEGLNSDTYQPRGRTALLDAIGKTISDTKTRLKDDDVDVVIVITTDGLENASLEYRLSDIQKLIKNCEEELGWKFLYLAADDCSFAQHDDFSVRYERAVKSGRSNEAHEYASDLMSKKLGLYRRSRNEKDLEFTKQERDNVEELDC